MKKLIFLVFALMWVECFGYAQKPKYEPCAPYKEGRSLEEAREFFKRDGLYYENLRVALVGAVSEATGNPIAPTKAGVDYIIDHSVYVDAETFIDPDDYENGVKFGTDVVFTNLKGRPSKYWFAFQASDGKDYPYVKAACLNIQKKRKTLEKGKPLYETAKLDTVKTVIKGETVYYDSIVHIEYIREEELYMPYEVPVMICYPYQQPYFNPPVQSMPIVYNNINYINIVNVHNTTIQPNHNGGPGGTPLPEPNPGGPGGTPLGNANGDPGGAPVARNTGNNMGGVPSAPRDNSRATNLGSSGNSNSRNSTRTENYRPAGSSSTSANQTKSRDIARNTQSKPQRQSSTASNFVPRRQVPERTLRQSQPPTRQFQPTQRQRSSYASQQMIQRAPLKQFSPQTQRAQAPRNFGGNIRRGR